MYDLPSRRLFLQAMLAGGSLSLLPAGCAFAAGGPTETHYTFDDMLPVRLAQALAARPYSDSGPDLPEDLTDMDYDSYQAIRPRKKGFLWAQAGTEFRIDMFHLGRGFRKPVELHVVDNGVARRIDYSPDLFRYGAEDIRAASDQLENGFAGFRAYYAADWERDFIAFLGASYFRAVGGSKQYGLSARGLAVNTSLFGKEEFPRFTTFWLEKPGIEEHSLIVHALLDSPSVTGTYRFTIRPGGTTSIDVDATIFARKEVEELGIAPITSMYFYGENDYRARNDFRPEVHDSDGLYMVKGNGEHVWRPVENPSSPRASFFGDRKPAGFGLCQRDRQFDHYQDDGVYYDRRPNLWVEPSEDWGDGDVVLVELPAGDETEDNLAAYWRPKEGLKPGQKQRFRYALHFGAGQPVELAHLASVVATRTGIGGVPGQKAENPGRKFVVDFQGGSLPMLSKDASIQPQVSVTSGKISALAVRQNLETGGWRMNFDCLPDGDDDVEMHAFLEIDGRPLTETWLYRWNPSEKTV
ncbi:glucan biosynthesis protein [Aestuariispira ectoiniformans]|uniref:glucan biosynthesis protein n=1 Tax=Aestuariispira ectoiniformans TaxID=2775080 RepID=UPI00223AA65B|nr:glucan biosynthesis protein [Aestuariispira ectoiniformans]